MQAQVLQHTFPTGTEHCLSPAAAACPAGLHQDKMPKVIGPHLQLKVVFGVRERNTKHSSVEHQQVNPWFMLKGVCKALHTAQICQI